MLLPQSIRHSKFADLLRKSLLSHVSAGLKFSITSKVTTEKGFGDNILKVLQINTVCGSGSVGRIATDLMLTLKEEGHDCEILYGRRKAPEGLEGAVRVGSNLSMAQHVLATFFKGEHGFASEKVTERMIACINEYQPDVIQLHNIHGFYLNVEMLFNYLKVAGIPVVWTLHDCWSFTGHCAYFDYAGCDRWKEGCGNCPQHRTAYPYAIFKDNSRENYKRKEKAFTKVPNLTIVTPSQWLADLVGQSFLKKYPVKVIPNGIDREVFSPMEGRFRRKYGLQEKKVLLGVANIWEKRKGLNVFLELASRLPEEYQIVLVGVSDRQSKKLPEKILGIPRTGKPSELAQWYTLADIYVNPTYEDNFPTTNLEALSCGTPVITFATGGSPEAIDASCGKVVPKGDVDALLAAILDMEESPVLKESCILKSRQYDKEERFREYIKLYEDILEADKQG